MNNDLGENASESMDELAARWRAHAEQALARLAIVRERRKNRRNTATVIAFPTRPARVEHDI